MIIIQGSSRSTGNTTKVSEFIADHVEAEIFHLADFQIADFSYDGPTKDDFEFLINQIIKHKKIVFATPIYWYTMSGKMKTFFDRISDLLKWNKNLGRQLRGLEMFVISCSGADDPPKEFDYPFRMSADYLGMKFKGHIHTYFENGVISSKSKNQISILGEQLRNSESN